MTSIALETNFDRNCGKSGHIKILLENLYVQNEENDEILEIDDASMEFNFKWYYVIG